MESNDTNKTPHRIRQSPDELMAAEVWIFDLDNTLYPAASKLFDQVDWNMTRFVGELLNLEQIEARKLQKQYFREYGTTMRGLMTCHDVDPKEFMDYVHDIDLAPISANPILTEALAKLPGRKVIYTNGTTTHAQNITQHLQIDHHFEGCFDIIDAKYVPKPATGPYETFCVRFDIDPKTAIMVEDMARNLLPAAALGMTTVWLDTDVDWARYGSEHGHVHHRTVDIATWLKDVVSGVQPS